MCLPCQPWHTTAPPADKTAGLPISAVAWQRRQCLRCTHGVHAVRAAPGPERGLTWMTALKVSSMARQRALLPVMEPSAYCRPSCRTAGCTLAAIALSWKTLPIVIACRHRKQWHPVPNVQSLSLWRCLQSIASSFSSVLMSMGSLSVTSASLCTQTASAHCRLHRNWKLCRSRRDTGNCGASTTHPVLGQVRKDLRSLPPTGPVLGLDLLQRPCGMWGGRRRRLPALGRVPDGCATVRPIASGGHAACLLACRGRGLLAGLRFLRHLCNQPCRRQRTVQGWGWSWRFSQWEREDDRFGPPCCASTQLTG